MEDVPKPSYLVGDCVTASAVGMLDDSEGWAGSIVSMYWSSHNKEWVYRVAKLGSTTGKEVEEKYILKRMKRRLDAKEEKVKKYSPWDAEMARALAEAIEKNKPTPGGKIPTKATLENWAVDFRMMRELDNISKEDIMKALAWSQQDHFFKSTILSAGKFRDKYTAIQIARANLRSGPTIA